VDLAAARPGRLPQHRGAGSGLGEQVHAQPGQVLPAARLRGFQRLQAVHQAGYENKDYRSANLDKGLKELATGQGAQYPMLTAVIPQLASEFPSHAKDIGFFAQPGNDAAKNGVTLWLPAGVYVPKTTSGAKLDAAKKFVAFIASPPGCDIQTKANPPTGPYLLQGCELPANTLPLVKDVESYVKDPSKVTPALEFVSPVKGPSLEQLTVAVGSGLNSAAKGASLYDRVPSTSSGR
jgi:raffinose/stachyose/melibiose transport system substrate-binding protein